MGKKRIGLVEVKVSEISKPLFNVVEYLDTTKDFLFSNLTKNHSQYKSILICQVDGNLLVLDGYKYLQILKKNKFKKVYCFNIGKIDLKQYLVYRILLNIHLERLDYLGIAAIVNTITNQSSIGSISSATGMDEKEVERYSQLLNFNWDKFKKEKQQKQDYLF